MCDRTPNITRTAQHHNPFPRPDIEMDSTDFESVWVEVEKKDGKNYFFVVPTGIQAQLLTLLVSI